MESTKSKKLKNLIIDVDGVLTDGQFHYTAEGKVAKIFGPDDHDALLLLKPHLNIVMITGDKKGWPITHKRVAEDMKFPLHLVSTVERIDWMTKHFDLKETIYVGDGIFDAMVFQEVGYAIAPANAFFKVKELASYVTAAKGGEGAMAEACWHLMEIMGLNPDIRHLTGLQGGEWGK